MARLGVRWDSMGPVLRSLAGSPELRVAGTFTHFASADESDPAHTLEQISRFESALAQMRGAGIDPAEVHLSNSAGLLCFPGTRCCSARPGIALYGYPPAPDRCPLQLRPALTLKSRVGRIHRLNTGESIGYNGRFVAQRPTVAATLPIGYADGYRRGLTGKGRVLIRGCLVPVLGTISMDMIVIDITNVPEAVEGDEVVLLGPHDSLTAEDWAGDLGTISYEVLCGLSNRVPRTYSS